MSAWQRGVPALSREELLQARQGTPWGARRNPRPFRTDKTAQDRQPVGERARVKAADRRWQMQATEREAA